MVSGVVVAVNDGALARSTLCDCVAVHLVGYLNAERVAVAVDVAVVASLQRERKFRNNRSAVVLTLAPLEF